MNKLVDFRREMNDRYPNSFELDVGADQTAVLLVIDDSFENLNRVDRLSIIEPLLSNAGLNVGIVDLYTSEEASKMGLSITNQNKILPPANWDDAVSMADSGIVISNNSRVGKKPHRIVFYSYKGGVGRTTALVHTAFHLARGGSRVAIVDMDVEAPSLHILLPRPDGEKITAGLVDYLWERQVRPFDPITQEGLETCLVAVSPGKKNAISYVVEDPISRAQISVIPAGIVGSDYIRKLHTLSYQDVLSSADDAWTLFEKELVEQLEPDVLLIDARTGLGDWGGLSLLRLADEAFLVLFPSDQNIEGFKFVRNILNDTVKVPTHLVLSPVPDGAIGKAVVSRILPSLQLEDDEHVVEISYNPAIASATAYPVESAMSNYSRISNIIRENEVEENLELTINKSDRWGIIESLKFPERDARTITAGDFDTFFQKTSDFDKFLDDARWVVRGRKGTGKSTLFHLFVEHQENAVKRAQGKLRDVLIIPGHGPVADAAFRPTTDEFGVVQRALEQTGMDWLSLWRAYAIVRIFTSKMSYLMQPALTNPSMKSIKSYLADNFTNPPPARWRSEHTVALLGLVKDPFSSLCRDLFGDVNLELAKSGKKLWILYDDLDQDIKEDSGWQGDALGGLLRLAYDSNNQDLYNIRLKIFLREDIWNKLVFTNKSHFGEPRTLLLQWKIEDFLRLAYRLTTGGSALFLALAQRHYPISDAELDIATEEQLRRALAPLWGLNQEKSKNAFASRWVYNRMTDSRDNTYPRSLTVLLKSAKEAELEAKNGSKVLPSNRLLSPMAMQAGLEDASKERVNALKNEYPMLLDFLQDVQDNHSLRSQFTTGELESIWKKTSIGKFSTFESFVAQLENSGLLTRKNGKTYDYGFAQLYIDGLTTRVQGEKK